MQCITTQPPPTLPAEFSGGFKDFVSICLRKQGGTRLSSTELLKHPFLKKFVNSDAKYLRRWIRTIN